MTSPPAAQNALAKFLLELERLGLARPANVLLTEYLAALVAENVIDTRSADRIAAVYHRLHYGTVSQDNLDEQAAVESLRTAVIQIGGLGQAERQALAERIAGRLRPQPADSTALPVLAVAAGQAPSNAKEPAGIANGIGGALSQWPFDRSSAGSPVESCLASEPRTHKGRRGLRIRSLPLETATLLVLGLIFCGYVLRNGIDQTIGPRQAETAASGRPRVIARDVWRHEDYWALNLYRRGRDLAAHQHDEKARLAFELLLTDVPRDAEALNSLAWLYLTTNNPAVRNPQRGLELALQAVDIRREPQILDTAAEARFQTGQPAEAVKLEQEAIDTLPRFVGFEDKRFWNMLQEQLAKFQKAAASTAPVAQ